MADNELNSPLRRARLGLIPWLDLLDKDSKLDACMALDKLCQVAEREIEQAYIDGAANRSSSTRAQRQMPKPGNLVPDNNSASGFRMA